MKVTTPIKFLSLSLVMICSSAVSSIGQTIITIAGNGTNYYSGDGGAATAANISYTGFIKADTAGNIYFADGGNSRVRKVTPSGVISTFAGSSATSYGGDGGQATDAGLVTPMGIAIDDSGNVFIADQGDNRVRKVSRSGIITTIAGTGTSGYSGDGGHATAALLNAPVGVAVNHGGDVFISDANQCIRKVAGSTGIISTFAGTGTAGFAGDGGAATAAQLYDPAGIYCDVSANLYVADKGNARIRKINGFGIISTFAGNGGGGALGDGGPATAGRLLGPVDVMKDNSGNFFVSDNTDNRVRIINPSGTINTFVGTGAYGYNGDGIDPSIAKLASPVGITTDRTGYLYICDDANYRVRKVTPCNPMVAPITGPSTTCAYTLITLSDTTFGGDWSSSNPGVAEVTYGNVLGLATGTVTISYTLSNSCGTTAATKTITITPMQSAGDIFYSKFAICVGGLDTFVNYSATSAGTWSLYDTTIAKLVGTSVAKGLTVGIDTVYFSFTNACGTYTTSVGFEVIDTLPNAGTVSSLDSVCPGKSINLSASAPGGYWLSSDPSIATVGVYTGRVTGLSTGADVIVYGVTNACGTDTTSHTIYVLSPEECHTEVEKVAGTNKKLEVYPNPTAGAINVFVPSEFQERAQFSVFNMLGQRVVEMTVPVNTSSELQLQLPTGIYNVVATTKDEKVSTRLVIE